MSFAAPAWLLILLVIPILIALYLWVQRRRARWSVSFTNLDVLAKVVATRPTWRRHVPAALYLLALCALLMGMARPESTIRVPREQATIVLALDASGSMRATDVEPTRLTAAQESARSFIDQLPDKFQVGVVSFAEQAQVLNQPTTDRVAVIESIDSLLADGPTAMGDAVDEALDLGRSDEKPAPTPSPGASPDPNASETPGGTPSSPSPGGTPLPKDRLDAIVLLSDGYNTSGAVTPLEAAERASELGIPVYTIALGTPEGTVEVPDRLGIPRVIRVPPDYQTLAAMAETTGAESFTAPSEDDLRRIYEDLGSRIGFVDDKQEITFAFAAAGALIALLGAGLGAVWSGRIP
ncbi:MAG: VWA domain-containing protein [Actinomycetota bacterium]|nr:VWA domain-containing protein [Actinomycetota bacterium]